MAKKAKAKSKKSPASRGAVKSKSTTKRRTSAPTATRGAKASTSGARGKSKPVKKTVRAAASTGGKVGSSDKAARRVGGRGDFGARESDQTERAYASRATKSGDPGAAPAHNVGDGTRVSGVGGSSGGVGASSGGDLDTDFIGVGTGGTGIAASGGTDRTTGADITEGEADTFSAKPPAKKQGDALVQPGVRGARVPKQPKGDFVDHSGGDISSTGEGEGAASISNERRDDDSFAGEVSLDEASGADNSDSDRG